MLNLLIEYKERNGDCHVPSGNSKYSCEERERLGVSEELTAWVAKQRKDYRYFQGSGGKKLKDKTVQIQILTLESMGFMWSDREAQWQRSFNRLEAYGKANKGSLLVDKAENYQLWRWADQQRKEYQKGKLVQERQDLLDDIGFIFDVHEAKWWGFYEKLCEYKEEYGDTVVPIHQESLQHLGT